MSRPAEPLDAALSSARVTASGCALREAANWRVQLSEDPVPVSTRRAFERWLQCDEDHALAWREIEATWHAFDGARRPAARAALEHSHAEERGEVQRLLGRGASLLVLVLAILPVIWIGLGIESPGHLLADHHTAIGERQSIALPDGSRLVLDTATAVGVEFTADRRRIRLRDGRLFIDVAPDPDRPLEIVTAEARATALGTRFSVYRLQDSNNTKIMRVSVHESMVQVCPAARADGCRNLQAGQQVQATHHRVDPPVMLSAAPEPGWVRGYLEIDDRPLTEVLNELARYHRGMLHVDEAALEGLNVSGVIPLDDIDRALHALAGSQPIEVRRYTPWVTRVTREP